jgi:protein tyrosine phosphatase (PTP) superfamily phosphohydrolase (DUF442 family)
MEYVWIPLGGRDHPYTPAAVDRFAEVMTSHGGLVFAHCTIGGRAAYVWVAYLTRDQGVHVDYALARGRAIAIPPSPLESLLGQPLTLCSLE